MIEIDGARYSGSGTIVRQAVVFSALTRVPVHIVNARVGRPKPGLRLQHVTVVKAISELVDASVEGLAPGSRELKFRPGSGRAGGTRRWDIGSAGSTTSLALAILPVLAFGSQPTQAELHGGLFQDGAPSFFHLQQVALPLLRHMGLEAEVVMVRPGYVPRGEGVLLLKVQPVERRLDSVVLPSGNTLTRLWGIALSSHLEERRVSHRMAEAANEVFTSAGLKAEIEIRYDTGALQSGAALAVFADLDGDVRLGADRAGARGRRSETIGRYVAQRLLRDLSCEATLDCHAADQVLPFAALAAGESRFRIPEVTDHVLTNAWLAETFLEAKVKIQNGWMTIAGAGLERRQP